MRLFGINNSDVVWHKTVLSSTFQLNFHCLDMGGHEINYGALNRFLPSVHVFVLLCSGCWAVMYGRACVMFILWLIVCCVVTNLFLMASSVCHLQICLLCVIVSCHVVTGNSIWHIVAKSLTDCSLIWEVNHISIHVQ